MHWTEEADQGFYLFALPGNEPAHSPWTNERSPLGLPTVAEESRLRGRGCAHRGAGHRGDLHGVQLDPGGPADAAPVSTTGPVGFDHPSPRRWLALHPRLAAGTMAGMAEGTKVV